MTISTSSHPNENLRDEIRAEALRLGFDTCGFASASDAWPNGGWLREFVAEGFHGAMGWMEETLDRRSHPTAMWQDATTAVVLGVNYGPEHDPLIALEDPSRAAISVYAQGDDYHEVIKKRLKALARWMHGRFGGEVKVFVDTAPLMEKPLAQRAGLGWQGKHTNLVSRQFGSWLFLGSVLTTLDLPADPPERDHCGSCSACLDICPTNAFPAPHRLDARRCISYLTIELSGPIPMEFRQALGNRIYGCDDCLAACPWNKFASLSSEMAFHARETLKGPSLAIWRGWTIRRSAPCSARARSSASAATASCATCSTRSATAATWSLMAAVEPLLADPSPVVRGAAVWAAGRLAPERLAGLRASAPETDEAVLSEWDLLRQSGAP
jgi:epoxyqueuosine reductase